jgi:hypothetical protein
LEEEEKEEEVAARFQYRDWRVLGSFDAGR